MNFDERMAQIQRELPTSRISGELECPISGDVGNFIHRPGQERTAETCRTCNYIQVIDLNSCSSYDCL